jgi:hypothetical protein
VIDDELVETVRWRAVERVELTERPAPLRIPPGFVFVAGALAGAWFVLALGIAFLVTR